MKRDERDIICQQDYTTLSSPELLAHIELYASIMHNTPLGEGEWLDDIIGPARVLLARVEAAEAERDDLRDANGVLSEALEAARQMLVKLTARVAELEAQLAAQGWRPVTDDEPEEATEVELLAVGYRDGGNWYYHDDNPVRGWRPLPPPAPDTETTP